MYICYISIASVLLDHVLQAAEKNPKVKEIYLHVQVNNEGARRFYREKGFTEGEIIPNYYKKVEPADCYVLRKSIDRLY